MFFEFKIYQNVCEFKIYENVKNQWKCSVSLKSMKMFCKFKIYENILWV